MRRPRGRARDRRLQAVGIEAEFELGRAPLPIPAVRAPLGEIEPLPGVGLAESSDALRQRTYLGSGAIAVAWCSLVQSGVLSQSMPSSARPLRQSVSLSAGIARKVRALARAKRASTSRVIAELVESGLQVHDAERDRFLMLADRLAGSSDPAEQQQLKEELARLTFGN
jgi:hypothetical protein